MTRCAIRIRWLLREIVLAQAWHKTVLANVALRLQDFLRQLRQQPPYAQMALKLQAQPKIVPLMQATHLIVPPQLAPTLKPVQFWPQGQWLHQAG